MQHETHPADERLAAYAGGDPELTADAALSAHLSACPRCTALVDELAMLRIALAELPDLVPSRRLQLLPPVPAPAETAPRFGWLRRLGAVALAAGGTMVLVGAIGISGVVSGSLLGGAASGASMEAAVASDRATDNDNEGAVQPSSGETLSPDAAPGYQASTPPSETLSGASPGARADETDRDVNLFSTGSGSDPWLPILLGGAVLLVGGATARVATRPRAG